MVVSVMARFLCLLLTILDFHIIHGDSDRLQLVMSNVAYRHGDRSPIATFPKDEHFNFWKNGLGQLTERGMAQEFAMGKFLRARYVGEIVNQTYLRKQVYCRSSDKDRTLMSAEAQMAGLYPPEYKVPLPSKKAWQFSQLIPIHVVPKNEDNLLRPVSAYCPKYHELVEKSLSSPEMKKMQEDNADFLRNVSAAVGLTKSIAPRKIYSLNDMFFCQRAHNLSLPKWATKRVLDKLARLGFVATMALYDSSEKRRLTGGILVGQMIENMKNYVKDPGQSKKLYVYSTHDTTIIAVLAALGLFNKKLPPYSATFLMELYQNRGSKKHYVRMFYRNDSSRSEPYELFLPNCNPCNLDAFVSATAGFVPEDYNTECETNKSSESSVSVACVDDKHYEKLAKGLLAGLIIIVLSVLILGVMFLLKRYYKKRKERVSDQRPLYSLVEGKDDGEMRLRGELPSFA